MDIEGATKKLSVFRMGEKKKKKKRKGKSSVRSVKKKYIIIKSLNKVVVFRQSQKKRQKGHSQFFEEHGNKEDGGIAYLCSITLWVTKKVN